MANDTQAMTPTTPAPLTQADRDLEAVLVVFNALDSVDEDPTPRMMRAVMEAPDPRDWEKIFTAAHFKDSAGKRFILNNPRRAPSAFQNRFGNQYLVVDAYNPRSGEATVLTVGSEMAIAQLLACQARDFLPAEFEVVRKKEPTRAGFYPMRLSFVRKITAPDAEQA